MYSGVIEHISEKIKSAVIQQEPYNWIEIDNFWPEDFYQLMLERRISSDCMFSLKEMDRVKDKYSDGRLVLKLSKKITILSQPIRQFWEDVGDILRGTVEPLLMEKFKIIGSAAGREVLYTRDSGGYRLGPHTDRVDKLFTALFYLPQTAQNPTLGTAIFTPRVPGFTNKGGDHFKFEGFDVYKVIPYVPNKMFCFLKSQNSFHGVLPVEVEVERDLLIFDVVRQQCLT